MIRTIVLAVLYGISSSVKGPTNTEFATHVGRAWVSLLPDSL